MASPRQSQGVGPPDPTDTTVIQPKAMLHGDREVAVATAVGPATCVAAATSRLCGKAFLVLAICLSATALLHGLGMLAALPQAPMLPLRAWMGSSASQRRTDDVLVATRGDLHNGSAVTLSEKVSLGSVGITGCCPGTEGDATLGTGAEGWSLRTVTAATASPLTAWTSPRWQAGSWHGEKLRVGTAAAVTQGLGTGVPAASSWLLQTVGDPSPGSWHPLALGSLRGPGFGLYDLTQMPAVTSAHGLEQPMGTEPQSLGAHVPSDAPEHAGTLMGTPSQSPSTADQPRGDHTRALGLSPEHWTMAGRADLSLVSSKPPAVVTASDLPPGAVTAEQAPSSVPASDWSTTSGFSDVQHGAPVARATRSCNGQKKEVRPNPGMPDLGMGKDHTAALHLVPLPEVPSALPTERTSSSTKRHLGTVWVPSGATPGMFWDVQPAGTFMHGEAALLVDTISAKVLGNGSGLLATVLASLPRAHVNHPQVLAPSLPTTEAGAPAATSGISGDLSSPPGQQTLLTSPKAHPLPAQTRAPSTTDPAVTGVSLSAPDAIPEPGVTTVPCKDGAAVVASLTPTATAVTRVSPLGSPTWRPALHPAPFFMTASEHWPTTRQHQATEVAGMTVLPGQMEAAAHVEPRTASGGPPATPRASPGSASPPSSENHCAGTTSMPSPSYLPPSTGAVHAASFLPGSETLAAPAAVTPDAQSTSSPSGTSQHLSTASEYLLELLTTGRPGFPGVKPPASHPPGLPSPAQPVHVLPLQFRLLGIAYSEALSSRASESYRELEEEVRLMLNQMLSTYETFLQANVLEFMNGSVVVRAEALFRGDVPAPTNSHLVRTVITEASRGRSIFSWQLELKSVQSSGFSPENLDLEKLSVSLTVLQLGRNRTDSLERLLGEVTRSLSTLHTLRNFTIVQLRNLSGELEITGDIYLNTIVHADVAEVLQALMALANCSVDLTSLSVEGARLDLQVYPISFLITNRHFSEDLLDPLALEHQELARHLGDVVAKVLRDHRSFLQVVIRGFLPGSLICHGDVIFQHPAPTSLEVLEALVLSIGPNKALAGSDLQVDPYSLAVGEATLEPPQLEPGSPEYTVVIMVLCSLCIVTLLIVLLVEPEDAHMDWQDDSA